MYCWDQYISDFTMPQCSETTFGLILDPGNYALDAQKMNYEPTLYIKLNFRINSNSCYVKCNQWMLVQRFSSKALLKEYSKFSTIKLNQ